MGQAESNVTSGVKKQAGVSTQQLYKFVNLKGGGLLVDMMKRAIANKQFAEIDHAIKTKVKNHFAVFPSKNLLKNCRWSRFYITKDMDVIFLLTSW